MGKALVDLKEIRYFDRNGTGRLIGHHNPNATISFFRPMKEHLQRVEQGFPPYRPIGIAAQVGCPSPSGLRETRAQTGIDAQLDFLRSGGRAIYDGQTRVQ